METEKFDETRFKESVKEITVLPDGNLDIKFFSTKIN